MQGLINHEQEICRFMADDYALKIMSATYGKALSVPQISKFCDIPVAVAYRRVRKMTSAGLLACVREEEGHQGRKERFYLCAVDRLLYAFNKGTFSCLMCLETHPMNPMAHEY